MPGGVYNPSSGYGGLGGLGNTGGVYGGSYGNRNPYEGGSINGPYPGAGGMFPGGPGGLNGLFAGGDPDGKTSIILPLAGAALLGNTFEISIQSRLNFNFYPQALLHTL